jgi:hypothetical protein
MLSTEEIQKAIKAGENFKPAILSAKYCRDTDSLELQTAWCIIIIGRARIEELREVSQSDMETISVSDVGIHVDKADVDINSAGLITDIAKQLIEEALDSF